MSEQIQLSTCAEHTEIAAAQAQTLLVMASIKAPEMSECEDQRAPISVSAVIDRSGSMQGAKLQLTKATLGFVIKELKDGDQFGIVSYSDDAAETLKLTNMDHMGRQRAMEAVNRIQEDGCTNLSGGLFMGLDQLQGTILQHPGAQSASSLLRRQTAKVQHPGLSPIRCDSLTLKIGNAYRAVSMHAAKSSKSAPTLKNQHKWTMFVRLGESQAGDVADYVQSVEYQLHPTFSRSTVAVTTAPFEVSRSGWGTFVVGIRVTLRPRFGSAVHTFDHELNFASPETFSTHTVQVTDTAGPHVSEPGQQAPPQVVVSSSTTKAVNDVTSVWLFTDGLANRGITTGPELVRETKQRLEAMTKPCSIFSFGFGADHNAQMLKEVADAGKGMYYFIEDENNIASSFADCLGGLQSVVAQNIRLTIEPQPGCTVQKVFTKYDHQVTPSASWVQIPDLYSEEERDLVVEVQVDPVDDACPDPSPILAWAMQYTNLITGQSSTVAASTVLARPEVARPQPPPAALDRQRNRLLCAEALEMSKRRADEGRLEEARTILRNAMDKIRGSATGADAFCVGLCEDLQDCEDQMVDVRMYRSKGGQMMMNMNSCHSYQRSCGMKAKYMNKKKSAMVLKSAAMEEE